MAVTFKISLLATDDTTGEQVSKEMEFSSSGLEQKVVSDPEWVPALLASAILDFYQSVVLDGHLDSLIVSEKPVWQPTKG